MDKLRNILYAGKSQDDEVLYGDGTKSRTNEAAGSDHGSQIPSSTTTNPAGTSSDATSTTAVRDGVSGTPQQGGSGLTSGSTMTAGPHSSDLANKVDPRVDSDRDGSGTIGSGVTSTAGPHSSNLANKADPRVDSDRDGSSVMGNTGMTGAISTAGPHSSHLANKADPRVDSDLDGSRTAGSNIATGTSGLASTSNDPIRDGDSQPTSGPHNSNLLNKMDPRVDSDRDGSKIMGNTALGVPGVGNSGLDSAICSSSTSMGAERSQNVGSNTSTSSTTTPHTSSLLNKLDPRVSTSGTITNDSSLTGTDESNRQRGVTGTGIAATGAAYEAEKHHNQATSGNTMGASTSTTPHSSNLLNQLDPRVDNSTVDASKTGGLVPMPPSRDFDANASGEGPHPYHTRAGAVLDPNGPPHVSDFGGSSGTEYTGSTANTSSQQGQLGRDTALAGAETTGTSSSNTTGPHNSSLLNKLDPRVDSNASGTRQSNTTSASMGSGLGSSQGLTGSSAGPHNSSLSNEAEPRTHTNARDGSNVDGTSDSQHGHLERDAAIATGAGGLGYEAEKHHHQSTSGMGNTSTTDSSSTTPHRSSLLNRLDPRVKTSEPSSSTSNTTGSSHVARDTGIVGATGVGSHEANKYHESVEGSTLPGENEKSRHTSTGLGSVLGHKTDVETGRSTETSHAHHHAERDAALAGTAGAGAYEAEKHHHHHHSSNVTGTGSNPTSNTGILGTGHHTGTTATSSEAYLTGPVHHSSLLNKLDPRVKKVTTDTPVGSEIAEAGTLGSANAYNATPVRSHLGSSKDESAVGGTTSSPGHHHGRDAALGAGAVGAGAVGAGAVGAGYEAEKHHGTSGTSSTAGPHSSNLANKADPRVDSDLDGSRTAGPSGTRYAENTTSSGIASIGSHETSKHEHHDQKSHGVLGFLHKDKTDEHATATGTTGSTDLAEHEHHKHDGDRNRLHKDPPASVMRDYDEEFQGGRRAGADAQEPSTATNLGRGV